MMPAFLLLLASAPGWAQLRVVDYNTGGDARAGMGLILSAFGAESVNGIAKAPDVIALQEQDSSATTTQAIVDILNSLYGAGTYARATLNGTTSGAGRPGLIYNTQSVSLITQSAVGVVSSSGSARQTMRYQLRPVGYDSAADFYVYSSHYKASTGSSNEARRNAEALAVRANADALGQGAHIIYAGDFNIYSSSEPMWTTLTGSGNGQAFDPINRVGDWSNNFSFRDVHTQSPVTTARYGGQITGGIDDRFDFQLVTAEFLDSEGLAYISGSYHAFGNTGTHMLNGEITSGSAAALAARIPGYSNAQATAVLDAIAAVSDHLPVVADYQLPAMMTVDLISAPRVVIVNAGASMVFSVANSAPVVAVNGADELDYAFSTSGALSGSGAGIEFALGGVDVWGAALETSTIGHQVGQLNVRSDSQAAANASFGVVHEYDVLDHAAPVFRQDGRDVVALDFGSVDSGIHAEITFSLVNLPGFRAGLDLDGYDVAGDADLFGLNLETFGNLFAGDEVSIVAWFEGLQPGVHTATYEFHFSDDDLPGSIDLSSQSLTFTAVVVPEPATVFLLFAAGIAVSGLVGRHRH